MRSRLTSLFRLFLRLFFRRIEITGLENVPAERGVIFAVNHPNALVDPLFVLCFAPRPVSFLGKAPLFGYPFIGWFVRAFDSIPVYRKQDNVPGSNRETFARAREVLARGGGIAIFPEGTTHSDSRLRELKTGAARIGLGAGEIPSTPLRAGAGAPLLIPTGIYYTSKQTFRSEALVVFGEGIEVVPQPLDEEGEPPRRAVEVLTRQIEHGLAQVTLQADTRTALELIERAETIFSAGTTDDLATELEIRRRFVEGYHDLSERDPQRLDRLASRIGRLESELAAAGLDPKTLQPHDGVVWRRTIAALLLFPVGLAGAVIHYPVYRLVGFLAGRFSRQETEVATVKLLAALLLYPMMWAVVAAVIAARLVIAYFVVIVVALPLLGFAALYVFETLDEVIGRARALVRRMFGRCGYLRLLARRNAIREEILAIAEEMGR